ncbi:hypothetical protein [Pragia fontium]|uniref:Uncharacterized protein n=1 Tax=Pragia fontium DSM 5563 = ATCC 49100 TaxID=1122977 RepID=A0AAJ4WAP7_9GAMM|nr:hypothetical protein [Pragia fontium]AKJ42814.1 hypothetical protein QQ39_12595 [Pragia fontium]SFC86735.1 hypothetical protein SAMN02745723_10536 [Pragia fontium DSM 5563 = ATCC 49100]VEJ56096.1 Uncharacterised protein [Pragia fontium]
MWFLKLLFKKKFDAEFVTGFFQVLSERIAGLELVWKKGGSVVAQESASSAVIKKGKKVLFSQGPRSGWVDPFIAGDDRQALIDVTQQFQLGREKPSYMLGIACMVIYLVIVFGTLGMSERDATISMIYNISVIAALATTGLMVFSYRANWSHNIRSVCATLWVLAIIVAALSSVLLLPLVWAANRQQLNRLYPQDSQNSNTE